MRDHSKLLSIYDSIKLGGDKCWYCATDLFPSTKTKDHFWPKSLGGRLCVVSCANCNRMKGNFTPVGFVIYLKELKKNNCDKAPFQDKFDRMIVATSSLWDRVKWSLKK
jgi:Zn-finger protein